MLRYAIAATLLSLSQAAASQSTPLYIFGGQEHKTFLGCLNCNEMHPKSVWNELSQFGFKNDFGVWNPFREFINPFTSYSMCNEFASDPPIVVDDLGNAYTRLTINPFQPGSVCNVSGNDRLCRAVKAVCASKN